MRKGLLAMGSAAALSITAVSGCMTGQSGKTSADTVGDLSNPPATFAQADKEHLQACGNGEVIQPAGAAVRRAPYVQQMSDHGTVVLWTTASNAPAVVKVTTPEGGTVADVPAQLDPAAKPEGARQLMARVSGLKPATIYCYQVLEGDVPIVNRTGFRTAPSAGSDWPVHIVAYGDPGFPGPDQEAVLEQIASVPYDLWINTGDIAFDQGTREQFEEGLFAGGARLLRSFPLFPASGNHDYGTDDAAAFREVFALPQNGGPHGAGRWYSFDWGNIHFVALDTERYSNEQSAWLDQDLAANELPWVIVFAHRPPYSSGTHGSDDKFRSYFVPVLEKHRVPLVITGHDHSYERSKPQNGVTYVVTGGGGATTRAVGMSSFSAFSAQVLHFVYITVDGGRLALHAIDATGREFDSAVIARAEAGPTEATEQGR